MRGESLPAIGLLRSLRFKMAATVILILAVCMSIVFTIQYRSFRREMLERLGLASTPLSDVIKGSLRHAMETRDLSELGAIVDNVSRQPGVIKVFVLDKRGAVKFSPVRAEIGTRVPLSDPTCQVCHRVAPEARSKTIVFTAADGARVFRNVNPIANEPACHRCHDPRDVLNGVLISDFSMVEVERRLAAETRHMFLALVLALGATGLAITLMMNRLVLEKIERVVQATRLLGRGRLDLAVPVERMDEIGQLGASFNEMVDGLRRAKAVRERKELLENVLDNVQDGVIVFDAGDAVVTTNRGAGVALGVTGQAGAAAAPPLGEDQAALLAQARREGPVSAERTLRRVDGTEFPALVRVVPLRSESDALLGSVAVVRDLTEEKLKARLGEQLIQAEKLAAVGRLAAGVAHELNNPLGNVLMYAKLLLERLPAGEPSATNATHIVDNTLRCRAIVRSLLDYSRQSEARMAWTDVNDMVNRSVALVAGELDRRHIGCEVRLDPALPRVRCDSRQMQQVMVNLLQNSIEAMENGDGRIRVSTSLAESGDSVRVAVHDSGPGVAVESRARIFEPFYTTKPQGTGLGLAISYGIVERHRGRLRFENDADGDGHGSTFFVELPVGRE